MNKIEFDGLREDMSIKAHYMRFVVIGETGEPVKCIAFITEDFLQDYLNNASFGDPNGEIGRFLQTQIYKLQSKPLDHIRDFPYLIFAYDEVAAEKYLKDKFRL